MNDPGADFNWVRPYLGANIIREIMLSYRTAGAVVLILSESTFSLLWLAEIQDQISTGSHIIVVFDSDA